MFLQLQKQFKVHSQPVTVLGKLYLWSVPVPFLLLTLYLRRSLFLRLFIFTFLCVYTHMAMWVSEDGCGNPSSPPPCGAQVGSRHLDLLSFLTSPTFP